MQNPLRSTLMEVALIGALSYAGATLVARSTRRVRRFKLTAAANEITVGIHGDGKLGHLLPEAAIPSRYLLVVYGADSYSIKLAGANDLPLGICTDSTAAGYVDLTLPLAVNLLGAVEGTQRLRASGVIAPGSFLVPDANGAVRALPTASGTYYIIGRSVATASTAAGDLFEAITCFPVQRVVA